MSRPQAPGQALGQSPDQTLQRLKQRENRLQFNGIDAGRYAQEQGVGDFNRADRMASDTTAHQWATRAHADAADLITGNAPSQDPRVLPFLMGAKRDAMAQLGDGANSAVVKIGEMAGAVRAT